MASKFILATILLAPAVLGAAFNVETVEDSTIVYERDVSGICVAVLGAKLLTVTRLISASVPL
jgi:hypothetical protein